MFKKQVSEKKLNPRSGNALFFSKRLQFYLPRLKLIAQLCCILHDLHKKVPQVMRILRLKPAFGTFTTLAYLDQLLQHQAICKNIYRNARQT